MSKPFNFVTLGNLCRFVSQWEMDNLHVFKSFLDWNSYREREAEIIRRYTGEPDRLLLELTVLEEEHPDPARRREACERLDQYYLENYCVPRNAAHRFPKDYPGWS